jgi:hypothetical protein
MDCVLVFTVCRLYSSQTTAFHQSEMVVWTLFRTPYIFVEIAGQCSTERQGPGFLPQWTLRAGLVDRIVMVERSYTEPVWSIITRRSFACVVHMHVQNSYKTFTKLFRCFSDSVVDLLQVYLWKRFLFWSYKGKRFFLLPAFSRALL